MYICLNNPQNTRKQNGNYGISIYRSRTAHLQLKKVRKDGLLSASGCGARERCLYILFKTTKIVGENGNGNTGTPYPRQVHCARTAPAETDIRFTVRLTARNIGGSRWARIELSLGGLFHLLYPTIAHLQCNVKFFFPAGSGRRRRRTLMY